MRNRLTKQAMGKDDSPTTMNVERKNQESSKYLLNSEFGEEVFTGDIGKDDKREETGHNKLKDASSIYASAVKEAKDLEEKALRCLKMAEVMLGSDAPTDVIERQAVDFMTMSNKSVLASLRRMREFEETISESRVAKIVDAVLEVIAEDEEEKEEDKKEAKEIKKDKDFSPEEDEDSKIAAIVEATLEVLAEEEEEKKEKKDSEDDIVTKVTAAVLAAMSDEKKKEEMMKEEVKEAGDKEKEEEEMKEFKAAKKKKEEEMMMEEVKEAAKGDKEKEEEMMKEFKAAKKKKEEEMMMEEVKEATKGEKEEEMKEEAKKCSSDISFDDGMDVTASDEDSSLLSQLFTSKEADEDGSDKEAKIKTLKNVTASASSSEIDNLASLWSKF